MLAGDELLEGGGQPYLEVTISSDSEMLTYILQTVFLEKSISVNDSR